MTDYDTSLRFDALRFPLIVGVVFLHSYETKIGLLDQSVGLTNSVFTVDLVVNLISHGIARTAVPIFFLMSGYLFFLGVEWSAETYQKKITTRIRTLLIPFIFWNLITLSLYALAQSLPATQGYFSGKRSAIADFGAFDFIAAVFGIGRQPIAYHFWFIRDLMLLAILSPAIYWLNKRAPAVLLSLALLGWIFNYWPPYIPSAQATFFFALGGLLAISGINPFVVDRHGRRIAAIYICVLFIEAICAGIPYKEHIHKANVLLGSMTVLFATRFLLHSNIKATLLSLSGSSFFVFAAHEPLLMLTRKIAYKAVAPSSTSMVLLLYFLVPTMVTVVLVLVHRALVRHFPQPVRLVTGGR